MKKTQELMETFLAKSQANMEDNIKTVGRVGCPDQTRGKKGNLSV